MCVEKCPVYPTELVFALDQSYDSTEQRFNRMVDFISSIIDRLNIMENNCPVGARVTVTAYDSYAWYLIRWFDYRNKKQLLQQLSQIKHQPPRAAQDIGNAMRFVARNIFKRTHAGPSVRRVAVFFSNRQAASLSSIITATMEFSALDIRPAVITFSERALLDEAFEFDNTGTFQVIPIPPYGGYEPTERLWRCTFCYDKCFPNVCAKEIVLSEDSYMDIAFLLENSQYIANDEYKAIKALVSSMLDNFDISSAPLTSSGDRVALLSYSPWDSSRRRKGKVKTEFDFTAYKNRFLMKNYIQTHLQQLSGEATIGQSLKWTIEDLFPKTPKLRTHKVIFVVSAGENYERRAFLQSIALRAKCQGFVIVVISLGSAHKDHVEELASDPLDHHLIRLGRIHKPDLDYIVKFLKPLVYSIRRGFNQYPPQKLNNECRRMHTGEDYLFTPEPREIALEENSFTGQELSAGRVSPLVLEDSGSDHLVYIPYHVMMPQELMTKYEEVQDSEEIASLTSVYPFTKKSDLSYSVAGDENHGRKEEVGLTYQPGDAALQEYYMDVAFLIDASHRVGNDDFQEVKAFLISVLDYFHIAPDPLTSTLGDRVAVLSYSPPGYMPNAEECPVYLEFDLVTYSSVHQMKHHLQNSLLKLNGDVFTGHALQWTVDNVFVGTPNLRKNKIIFVVSAGETNPLDKEVLRNVSLRAKCEGYSIFVFSFGPTHNEKELEELASYPLDQHLVQLGRIHKPDLNYIIKFIKPFVHLIRRNLIPGVYEIETENSELSDEVGSQEQHFFALGNNYNDSGTTADLIQMLYSLFSSGKLRTKDKEEAHSEEITANDKQRDEKGNPWCSLQSI
ncbi:Collagen alpha-5(VI) chain [Galemys pyrenaicus]|uniref:Collagen alpha-5(VI) chain n=1 Tax=Galemys pyrenaicus TaxID=202257 RepID=A0A8J6AFH0_GALPY|nr:Collagen alpha-5(VI) chain [Galemys pyrenaicus]